MCSQKSGNADNTYNANALSFFKKLHCYTFELLFQKQSLFDVCASTRRFFCTSESTPQK